MRRNLESQTGMSVSDWVAAVTSADIDRFADVVTWLKTEHGLGHFQARLVAEEWRGRTS